VTRLASSSSRVFSIDRFADAFKSTIEWMLKGEHGDEIEEDIKSFMENRKEFELNPDSPKALKLLVAAIVTQAWYYGKPSDLDRRISEFIGKFGANFRAWRTREELIRLAVDSAPPKIRDRVRRSLEELFRYSSIKQFTEELYNLAIRGRTKVLGEKGRNDYLRCCGYWNRIPMDRHEMRFIVRTGIYHVCSIKGRNDPLQKASLQKALTRFCSNYLKNYTVFEIDLGNALGIVDTFIWSFCSRRRYSICGGVPRCGECPP